MQVPLKVGFSFENLGTSDVADANAPPGPCNPQATLAPLLASLKPGQQILYVRPLTEGAQNWKAPWTQLVRRRAAQWGALLAGDKNLRVVAVAPHNYRGACCVADSAVLYQKVS